jgi:hypothetical protein
LNLLLLILLLLLFLILLVSLLLHILLLLFLLSSSSSSSSSLTSSACSQRPSAEARACDDCCGAKATDAKAGANNGWMRKVVERLPMVLGGGGVHSSASQLNLSGFYV